METQSTAAQVPGRPLTHARFRRFAAACVTVILLVAVLILAPIIYAPNAGDTSTPPPAQPGLELTQVVVATIDVPRDEFLAWFDAVPLADILPGSSAIPRVVGTEPVAGTWREVGAIRRVFLDNDTDVLETMERNYLPDHFAYKIWNVNGAGQRLIAYVRGEFHFTDTGNGQTHVEWRYAAKPRTYLALMHVAIYGNLAILPFLENGLAAIKQKAEAAAAQSGG